MTVLSIDFETRATVDLRETGVYPYAQHKDTDIWCMAWAFDDEEPEIWLPSGSEHSDDCALGMGGECDCSFSELPIRIEHHIVVGREIRAWNAAFERIIWNNIMVPRYGAPKVKIEQWVCSAAEAAAMALPRSLEQCAAVTGVSQQKDKSGYELMMRMTRPRKIHDDGRIEWWEVEERKQKLYAYCAQDVRTERALTKVLRRLTAKEREVYLETERMNDRGIAVDIPLVKAAKKIATEGIERANKALCDVTGGALTKVTQTGLMREWIASQGVECESVSKSAVREMLDADLDPAVRSVLELRAEAGRSSIAKLDSLLACCCDDGKIRGMLLFHGAGTGRWSGRLVQLQNLPRGTVEWPEKWDKDTPYIEQFIPLVHQSYDAVALFDNPISVVSSLLRSTITASEGCELIVADYAAIEARVLAVLAGQEDDVERFRQGEDVYKHLAARLYGVMVEDVTKTQRTTGKFAILGAGYGMGHKKAVNAAKATYGLELTEEEAKRIIDGYRSTHQAVVDFWYETERAAMAAVELPGTVQVFGALRNLKFTKQGSYLYLVLPSRRPLCYAAPKVVERETPWKEMKPCVEVSAQNGVTRKWERVALYGGLLVENVVQAVARDLLAEAMLRVDAAGYATLTSIHDEIVSEVPVGFGTLQEFVALMEQTPEWASGWPITAEGYRSARFRK